MDDFLQRTRDRLSRSNRLRFYLDRINRKRIIAVDTSHLRVSDDYASEGTLKVNVACDANGTLFKLQVLLPYGSNYVDAFTDSFIRSK